MVQHPYGLCTSAHAQLMRSCLPDFSPHAREKGSVSLPLTLYAPATVIPLAIPPAPVPHRREYRALPLLRGHAHY